MAELLEKAAVLRVIFDSVGKPATEIYQKVREMPTVDAAAEKPRWIPVTERLPEEEVSVIAWEKQGFSYVDYLSDGVWTIADHNYGEVTHWVPLPEPPEGSV